MIKLKIFILMLIILLFQACTAGNFSKINFASTIISLKKPDSDKVSKSFVYEILYKDRYGRIIQNYKGDYGYWYQIHRGDSLYRLSRRTGISIKILAGINRIDEKRSIRWQDYIFIPVNKEYIELNTEKLVIQFIAGKFIWPLYGRLTSPFGIRHRRLHKGIDIAAPLGTKIVASSDGEVIFSGRKRKYGNVIIINHSGNFQTRYAHLSKALFQCGETVKQGDVIGFVGKTGRATGYHLHFEIRIMGEPVNPITFLPNEPNELVKIYSTEKGY